MYLAHIPLWFQRLFPQVRWREKSETIHLTFDDGPVPEVTPWVLDRLAQYNVKATFFCVGENVQRHPEIFARILAEGHSVGNHSHTHLDAWRTTKTTYLADVERCSTHVPSKLFRPPYGHLTPGLITALRQEGYEIVMWDVLSCDFDQTLSADRCFEIVTQHAKPGSVVVLHDSQKAWSNLEGLLPRLLDWSRHNYGNGGGLLQ